VAESTLGQVSFGRYYRQFSSNYALGKENLLALAVPMISVNLILDFGRVPGGFWTWFLVAFVGYLAMLAPAGIVAVVFRRVKIPTGFYLPTYFLIGMIRGITIYILGGALGVIPDHDIAYRVIGSGVFVMAMMATFATLISNFDRAAKSVRELEIKRQSLQNRLSSMQLEISEQNSEITGRVSGLLSPVIADLIQRLSAAKASEIGSQVAALRNTVENVVRPMSQSVASATSSLSEPSLAQGQSSWFGRLNLDAKLRLKDVFLPSMSAFMLILISLPSSIAIAGPNNGITFAITLGASAWLILNLARYAFRKLEMGTFLAAMLHLLVHALIGLTALGAIYFVEKSLLLQLVARVFILVLIFGLTFFIGQARHLHLLRANEELQLVNTELEKLNAQAKQELWINRRRIATVLHGPIQAALYASAIRLAQAKRPNKKLIQEVTDHLNDALKELKFEQSSAMPVREVMREMVDLWSGVCTIYTSIPKAVHQVTNKHVTAAEAFSEVVREAVSNAVKHGNADEIEITAKLNDGVIDLQVINNGKPPTEKQASTGYGTRILNELTLSWSLREIDSEKTVFTAEIVASV
jgi:signal transduction histidine kinase